MFLNVSFYRKEILADEFGSLLIFIRLGIQPSTCRSRRSRAEVQQDGARLLFRCGQGLIDVLTQFGILRLLQKYVSPLRTVAGASWMGGGRRSDTADMPPLCRRARKLSLSESICRPRRELQSYCITRPEVPAEKIFPELDRQPSRVSEITVVVHPPCCWYWPPKSGLAWLNTVKQSTRN